MVKSKDKERISVKNSATARAAANERTRMVERIATLGIPPREMTESVTLAVSALLEKLDDTSRELGRAQVNFTELEQLVDVDVIAPVPNRRAFMRRLAWAISMHERYGHPCSILYFDLNDFKQVNDTYGHAAGDDVIRHVCQILLDALRDSDFMARLSGDEFAIIMYYAHLEDARERGAMIAQRLARSPIAFGVGQFFVTAACGAYEVAKGDDSRAALAAADAAMYAEKRRFKEASRNVTA
jgi:diguanylate cyclase (GGDEF)-like protein